MVHGCRARVQTNIKARSFKAHFEQVSVSQLGGPGVCPPENLIFKSKSYKMALAGNAFKTNMVW